MTWRGKAWRGWPMLLSDEWDEAKHPRNPVGSPNGGKFAHAGEAGAAPATVVAGQEPEHWMDYAALAKRDFKVSKTEKAALVQRTIAAREAVKALERLIDRNGSYAASSVALEKAVRAADTMILDGALFKVVEDEPPIFLD